MSATKNEFHLTADGIQALKDELHALSTSKRSEIAERLKEAKADGDLSENAMYDAARDEQSFVEGRISEIEHILKHAVVISNKGTGSVSLGSKVQVELEEGEQEYVIVGSTEANPDEGKISDQSPIGKALMGKKAGDEVEIEVPSGKITYKIKRIS
ncbi:MAG TPA: transcription elongation factor GreA [Candidatus Saccharimonadia bacterium]|jgi:transcription elongation factor GreA|nr:transcription elongation factor GreA [Candidatus Saccharimonadia bacterium]